MEFLYGERKLHFDILMWHLFYIFNHVLMNTRTKIVSIWSGGLWTTPDNRLLKGSPFSTMESALLLLELGMEPGEPLLKETADLIFSAWREDGRFKVYPQGSIYPCHTAHAANTLCHMGYASDARLSKTFRRLLDIQHADGGWRCNKFSFGRLSLSLYFRGII